MKTLSTLKDPSLIYGKFTFPRFQPYHNKIVNKIILSFICSHEICLLIWGKNTNYKRLQKSNHKNIWA